MSNHGNLLKQLLPNAYDLTGARLSADMAAQGQQLDAFAALAANMVNEIDPSTTDVLLPEWEKTYQLPDDGLLDVGTVAQRRVALVAKINATGGLSKPYFVAALAAAGYTAIIDQPRDACAGTARVGDRIYAPGATVWYWRVRLRKAGQLLSAEDKIRVAQWLNQLKPAMSFFDIED